MRKALVLSFIVLTNPVFIPITLAAETIMLRAARGDRGAGI